MLRRRPVFITRRQPEAIRLFVSFSSTWNALFVSRRNSRNDRCRMRTGEFISSGTLSTECSFFNRKLIFVSRRSRSFPRARAERGLVYALHLPRDLSSHNRVKAVFWALYPISNKATQSCSENKQRNRHPRQLFHHIGSRPVCG